jgi:YD repeat-containing protein
MRVAYCCLSGWLLVLIAGSICVSQVPTGVPEFGTYDADGVATINLAYLHVHLEIPLRSSTARNLPFPIFLTLESSVQLSGSNLSLTFTAPAWSISSSIAQRVNTGGLTQTTCNGQRANQWTIAGMTDGHGTFHDLGANAFSVSQNACPNPSSGNGTTDDGWQIYASVSSAGKLSGGAVDIQGRSYAFLADQNTVTDPNGNQLQLNGTSIFDSSPTYVDASGNTLLTRSGAYPNFTYSYTGPGAGAETYTPVYTLFTTASNFGCPGELQYTPKNYLITKLTRPDGSSYSFSYEPTLGISGAVTGRIASITLPTGGTISYSYTGGTHGINCFDGSTSGFKKTTPDGTWTYTHSTSNGYGTTQVTDPAGNYVVYNFAGLNEVSKATYQVGGTLLSKVVTCYNNNVNNCSTTNSVFPPITQSDVYTYPGTGSSPSLVETKFSLGLPTQMRRYGFGASIPPGSNYISQTKIAYGTWNGTSCAPTGISLAAVCSVITTDSAGNTKQAHYNTYDTRVNLVTAKDWVTGSTFLSKQFTNYPTGLVNIATDVNGTSTTYTNGGCNSSFPTGTSVTIGGIVLPTVSTWDCAVEVQTSVSDYNVQPTTSDLTMGGADPFWRPKGSIDPLGNETGFGYQPNPTYSQPAFFHFLTFGGSIDAHYSYGDGLGRKVNDQIQQSPSSSNFDTISYTYDSNGRLKTKSLPCVASYAGTCPTVATTMSYDTLNRPVTVTDAGGGTVSYSYTANDVLVTRGPAPAGENTKRRQMEYDGLGRLTSVCELSTAAGSGSCGQVTAGTGFVTRYTYTSNTVGQLFSVSQTHRAPLRPGPMPTMG